MAYGGRRMPNSGGGGDDSTNPFLEDTATTTAATAAASTDSRIFFVTILRNEEILVKYSQYAGNYDQILEQVLPKIVKTNGIKMTLNYEDFYFNYIYDNTIIYFCVTKNTFDKYKAFQFLEKIKSKFESQYQRRVHTALPFAFNAEFSSTLAIETKRYSENMSFDRIDEVKAHVDETKSILSENIERLTDRGEKLHLLVDKSDRLNEGSVTFKVSSRNLARKLFLKNIKMIIMLVLLTLVAVYLIVSIACGGLTWSSCIKNNNNSSNKNNKNNNNRHT